MTATTDQPDALALDGDALDPIGGGGGHVGYGRVSTKGQLLDRQIAALTAAGCQRIFTDKKSGKNAEREELWACLDYLRPGDILVVPSLDRLGRSLQQVRQLIREGAVRRTNAGLRVGLWLAVLPELRRRVRLQSRSRRLRRVADAEVVLGLGNSRLVVRCHRSCLCVPLLGVDCT
ncbi:recombinase family protein [Nocardia vinacea]|uniref:recombinase family protein n=1 Tax=Nocardia vinacea TaxID=96468 RepID=UPI002E0F44A6|nr:recombinase family protein [Nocardia vinacea]